jgi:hypothetical protein
MTVYSFRFREAVTCFFNFYGILETTLPDTSQTKHRNYSNYVTSMWAQPVVQTGPNDKTHVFQAVTVQLNDGDDERTWFDHAWSQATHVRGMFRLTAQQQEYRLFCDHARGVAGFITQHGVERIS